MKLLNRLLTLALALSLIGGFLVIAFLVSSNNPGPPPGSAPTVEFRSVELGDAITVTVNVSGDHVTRAELWWEDQLIARDVNPNPSLSGDWTVAWQWTPASPGVYGLAARAFDQAGRYGASSLFQVVVPPSQRLVYSSNQSGKYALYSISPDTRETLPLSQDTGDARQPRVSSTGTLVYTSNRTGAWHIYTRPLAGGTAVDLTSDLASAQGPVWSPDGQHLAFEVTESGSTNIMLSDAHGQNRQTLTGAEGYSGQVSFSPKGDRLVYASQKSDEWGIYVMDLTVRGVAPLARGAGQEWQPVWSPDGGRIAFASNRDGISQIYVMPSEGGNPVRLTSFPSGADQPAWSPDGNWLAFVGYTGGGQGPSRREIYLLYLPRGSSVGQEGEGLIRLTQNSFDDTEPAWAPGGSK